MNTPSGRRRRGRFLGHLVEEKCVASSTQNQALAALVFLCDHALGLPVGALGDFPRAKRPRRLPVVLSRTEVEASVRGTFRA